MTSDVTAIMFEIPNGTELTSNRMGGSRHATDADNWQPTGKIAIDALVKAGMFTDDRAEFIHATTYRRGRDLPTKGHHWITLHLMACPWDSHLACLESALAGPPMPI